MKESKRRIIAIVIAITMLLCGCVASLEDDLGSAPSDSPVQSQLAQTMQEAESSSPPDNKEQSTPPKEIDPDNTPAVEEYPLSPKPADETSLPEDSFFEIHFIDVGQGDSSLVICDGKVMLIDGGEASESSKIYAYLKSRNIDHLEYIVATHAHTDHVGGLSGALNYATVNTALCSVAEYDSKTFNSFVKYLGNQGVSITVPCAGDTFALGSATVTILGPVKEYDKPNDTSIVLRIDYCNTSFLFTGDAERTAEADIIEAGADLSATVLKVGHHGSDTSTSYPFLREIMPEYAVIQVGSDNSYGHPTEDTLSKLRDADVKVYRNDLQGTIICSSNGESVTFSTERNATVPTNPTAGAPESDASQDADNGIEYIGNKNSKKFHLPSCANLPAEKNRVFFSVRQTAIDKGFSPCGNCHP